MKKALGIFLALTMLVTPLLALASGISIDGALTDGTYPGEAEGFAGPLKVEVTVADGKVCAVKVLENVDTAEIYATAEASVLPAIVAAGTVNGVDVQAGATFSSKGILMATANALQAAGATVTAAQAAPPPPPVEPVKAEGAVYHGLGAVPNFRVGPGKDSTETQVYSFNVTMASALFDEAGKILDVQVDIYEVSTPNYDGESMPHFSGWPAKEGYNVTDHATGTVSGTSDNSEDAIKAEVNGWLTKRERGATYAMNPQNEWFQQMDFFEGWMIGKTVAEIREWFAANTTAAGRPIKPDTDKEEDIAKLAALSEEQKADLADVLAGATMSISDAHGLILEAIEEAYANKTLALQ